MDLYIDFLLCYLASTEAFLSGTAFNSAYNYSYCTSMLSNEGPSGIRMLRPGFRDTKKTIPRCHQHLLAITPRLIDWLAICFMTQRSTVTSPNQSSQLLLTTSIRSCLVNAVNTAISPVVTDSLYAPRHLGGIVPVLIKSRSMWSENRTSASWCVGSSDLERKVHSS